MEKECSCENKEYTYVCDDVECVPVEIEPTQYSEKVTFFKKC